jgi:hypothetical protein
LFCFCIAFLVGLVLVSLLERCFVGCAYLFPSPVFFLFFFPFPFFSSSPWLGMSAAVAEPQVRVGKQVRRADGVMMEEVITTTLQNNRMVSSTSYRPVGQQHQVKPVTKREEEKNLKALLGEEEDEDEVLPPPPRAQVCGVVPKKRAALKFVIL